MEFNTTFNNISAISWRSVLMVDETVVPGENHRSVASHWQTLSHNVISNTHRLSGIQTQNFSDCTVGCKSNYHTITTTTDPTHIAILYIGNICILSAKYFFFICTSFKNKKKSETLVRFSFCFKATTYTNAFYISWLVYTKNCIKLGWKINKLKFYVKTVMLLSEHPDL